MDVGATLGLEVFDSCSLVLGCWREIFGLRLREKGYAVALIGNGTLG